MAPSTSRGGSAAEKHRLLAASCRAESDGDTRDCPREHGADPATNLPGTVGSVHDSLASFSVAPSGVPSVAPSVARSIYWSIS
jgi:hypothetical protein